MNFFFFIYPKVFFFSAILIVIYMEIIFFLINIIHMQCLYIYSYIEYRDNKRQDHDYQTYIIVCIIVYNTIFMYVHNMDI